MLLFVTVHGLAADSDQSDYAVTIHVTSSSLDRNFQVLSVVIAGKNYSLISENAPGLLLALGDYKAKLVRDEHKTAYESHQTYEFSFPDKKTKRYDVNGQSE
jgi:hypothetical protein